MQPNAPVIEKLGMHFIRVMEDDGPEPPPNQIPMHKVVAPSGKVGYVPADAVSPLGNDQLCYERRLGLEDRRFHRRRAVSQRHRHAGRALEYPRAFVVIVLDGRRPRM